MLRLLKIGLLAAALTLSGQAMAKATKAIDFEFSDIKGKTVKLSQLKGKWVLVNFWAPWCPLCWVEVPALNELNGRPDFVVIGVGLDYGPDENVVREAAERHNLDFYAVVAGGSRRNPESPFRQVGPVDFYPTSYLYDPNGEIVMFIPGQVHMNKILAFIEDNAPQKKTMVAGDEPAGSKQGTPNEVKPVSYGKPASKPAPGKRPPNASKSRSTVTY